MNEGARVFNAPCVDRGPPDWDYGRRSGPSHQILRLEKGFSALGSIRKQAEPSTVRIMGHVPARAVLVVERAHNGRPSEDQAHCTHLLGIHPSMNLEVGGFADRHRSSRGREGRGKGEKKEGKRNEARREKRPRVVDRPEWVSGSDSFSPRDDSS